MFPICEVSASTALMERGLPDKIMINIMQINSKLKVVPTNRLISDPHPFGAVPCISGTQLEAMAALVDGSAIITWPVNQTVERYFRMATCYTQSKCFNVANCDAFS